MSENQEMHIDYSAPVIDRSVNNILTIVILIVDSGQNKYKRFATTIEEPQSNYK